MPASAQTPPLPDVPSFCSATSAFGQTMGSKDVVGAGGRPLGIAALVNLPQRYAPFESAEVVVSNYSRQINRVRSSLQLADEQAAERTAEAIRGQFRKAGWIEAGGKGLPEQAFNPLGDDLADFNSERGGLADPPTGRRVEIDVRGKSVTVNCVDLPGFVKHVAEAFAPPPVGVERPELPEMPPQNVLIKLDCTKKLDMSERALVDDEDRMRNWMERYKAVNDYFEQLMEWDGQQFVKAGKWTAQQKKAFERGLLGRPELKDAWAYFLNIAMQTLTRFADLADSADAGDDARACRALNGILDDVVEHGKRTLVHADAIDRIYRAEAAKLGVTLE